MKVNSDRGLALGRQALKEHGGSWTKVREAGTRRADGVIVVTRTVGKDSKPPAKRTK